MDTGPLETEFEFELPRGWADQSGAVHKGGSMRLATARDELLPLRDPRVKADPSYLTVVLLAQVVTGLGPLTADEVTPEVIETLFTTDLAYLQEFYVQLNAAGGTEILVQCPSCQERFAVDLSVRSQP